MATTTTTSTPVAESLHLVRNNAVINNRPSSNVGKVVETAVAKYNNDPDTKLYKKKIKQAINESPVLDYNENRSTPSTYVLSPILRYMQERCIQRHCIYVAYAPSGTGKTTAPVEPFWNNKNTSVLPFHRPKARHWTIIQAFSPCVQK